MPLLDNPELHAGRLYQRRAWGTLVFMDETYLLPLASALHHLQVHDSAQASHDLHEAQANGSVMANGLLDALSRGQAQAYDAPAAFEAFIRGGGNVALYEAVSEALARAIDMYRPAALLDIGAGDGMALLPSLGAARHPPARVDVVEPNAELLAALRSAAPFIVGHPTTLERFVEQREDRRWNMAVSSFALQSIAPQARAEALARLRTHVDRLLVVEFDVPRLQPRSRAMHMSLAQRYERAAREAGDDRALVARGFLAPMLLGQLQATTPSNYEQPAVAWADDLRTAGYDVAPAQYLHDYSWAPAFLLHAVPASLHTVHEPCAVC